MKKFRKIAVAAVLLALLLTVSGFGGHAEAAPTEKRVLTFDHAYKINSSQIVLTFSEPIGINLIQENRGPWISLRICDSNNRLCWTGGQEPYGQGLQWSGSIEYLDDNYDKLLFTLMSDGFDVTTIDEIMALTNSNNPKIVAAIREYQTHHPDMTDEKLRFLFNIEEVPYNQVGYPNGDGLLDNVTTRDGKVHMWANTSSSPFGWDGTYVPLEEVPEGTFDTTHTVSMENTPMLTKEVLFLGAVDNTGGSTGGETSDGDGGKTIVKTVTVTKDVTIQGEGEVRTVSHVNHVTQTITTELYETDPLIMALCIGGAVLIAAVLIILAFLLSRKKKDRKAAH